MDIKDFKYGFRYTNKDYALFSLDELSKIEVINSNEVRMIWDQICDDEVIERCSFIKKIILHELPVFIEDCGWGNDLYENKTKNLLLKYFNGSCDDKITLYYDCESAISVSKFLFCNRWSDFCYPSDSLLIKYDNEMLFYYEDIIYRLN